MKTEILEKRILTLEIMLERRDHRHSRDILTLDSMQRYNDQLRHEVDLQSMRAAEAEHEIERREATEHAKDLIIQSLEGL